MTIKVEPSQVSLAVGETKQLTATVSGAASSGITGKSTNESVASVSSNGTVTAKKTGNAVIQATKDGVTGTCVVTVKGDNESTGDDEDDLSAIRRAVNASGTKDKKWREGVLGNMTYKYSAIL